MSQSTQEAGQAVMEYAGIIALISVTMIALFIGFGLGIVDTAIERLGDLAGTLG